MQRKNKFHLTAAFNSIETSLREMTEKATDVHGFFKELKL